jgi:hypothetical protein
MRSRLPIARESVDRIVDVPADDGASHDDLDHRPLDDGFDRTLDTATDDAVTGSASTG